MSNNIDWSELMDAPFQNPGGNMRDPAPNYLAKIVQSKTDKQIQMMHVPGGMIIYRTCFHNTTPFHTAVYVPIHDPENYPWWFNKWFPTTKEEQPEPVHQRPDPSTPFRKA